MMYYR